MTVLSILLVSVPGKDDTPSSCLPSSFLFRFSLRLGFHHVNPSCLELPSRASYSFVAVIAGVPHGAGHGSLISRFIQENAHLAAFRFSYVL